MQNDNLNSAIRELEKLETEQERELNQTREMILTLKKRAGWAAPKAGSVVREGQIITVTGTNLAKETYGELCTRFLKEHTGPMHITRIMEKLSRYKKGADISRPAIQTCLKRLTDKVPAIRKVGPGMFQYFENGNGNGHDLQ